MRRIIISSSNRLVVAAIVVGLSVLLAACGSSQGEEQSAGSTSGSADIKACADIDLSNPPAEPVKLRIGRGKAVEEPLWLMEVRPELGDHQGEWYDLELMPFDSTETRLVALQAGEVDGVTISPQVFVTGTARGSLDLAAIGTIMLEAGKNAFGTTFVSMQGSGIDGIEDLKGKKIGIVGLNTDPDYLAKAAVDKAGYDFRTDAKYVVLPFPAQAEALRNGQIDVATLVEPFYTMAMSEGGLQDVFTAREVTGFDFDLLTLAINRSFIAEHTAATCAFRDDFVRSMDWYRANVQKARELLAGTEFVQVPLEIYKQTGDYKRPAHAEFDPSGFERLIDQNIKLGIFRESDRIDVDRLYIPGITAGQ